MNQEPAVPKNAIVIRSVNGLANRMLAIASNWALSEHLDLPYYVRWPGDFRHFEDLPFDRLFTAKLNFIDKESFQTCLEQPGKPVICHDVNAPMKESPAPLNELSLSEVWRDHVPEHGYMMNAAYLDLRLLLKRHDVSVPQLRTLVDEKLRSLEPSAHIRASLEAFIQRHFDPHVIGVHIRRGDIIEHQPVAVLNYSPDDRFVQFMQEQIERNPMARFYLATDCEATLDKFRRLFPRRILSIDKTFVASELWKPKAGQENALLELLLLSRTRKIRGTAFSTFGGTAARIGGIRYSR